MKIKNMLLLGVASAAITLGSYHVAEATQAGQIAAIKKALTVRPTADWTTAQRAGVSLDNYALGLSRRMPLDQIIATYGTPTVAPPVVAPPPPPPPPAPMGSAFASNVISAIQNHPAYTPQLGQAIVTAIDITAANTHPIRKLRAAENAIGLDGGLTQADKVSLITALRTTRPLNYQLALDMYEFFGAAPFPIYVGSTPPAFLTNVVLQRLILNALRNSLSTDNLAAIIARVNSDLVNNTAGIVTTGPQRNAIAQIITAFAPGGGGMNAANNVAQGGGVSVTQGPLGNLCAYDPDAGKTGAALNTPPNATPGAVTLAGQIRDVGIRARFTYTAAGNTCTPTAAVLRPVGGGGQVVVGNPLAGGSCWIPWAAGGVSVVGSPVPNPIPKAIFSQNANAIKNNLNLSVNAPVIVDAIPNANVAGGYEIVCIHP